MTICFIDLLGESKAKGSGLRWSGQRSAKRCDVRSSCKPLKSQS